MYRTRCALPWGLALSLGSRLSCACHTRRSVAMRGKAPRSGGASSASTASKIQQPASQVNIGANQTNQTVA